MRFPPFLIGISTLFWGYCTGWTVFSILAAVVFEASRLVKTKFDLKKSDYIRISDLSSVVMIILLIYSFLENEPRMIFLSFIASMPIVFMPLMFAQLYSFKDTVIIGTAVGNGVHTHQPLDIRTVYMLMIFVSSGAAASDDKWFLIFTLVLVLWLFSGSVKSTKSFLRYAVFSVAAFFLVFSISVGIVITHNILREKMMELYRNWYMSQTSDPFKSSTAMGETGYLKLSGNIVMRINPEKREGIPIYLKVSDYNLLSGSVWHSRSKDTISVFPDGEKVWQFFGEGEGAYKMSVSSWMGKGGKGVLALPVGSKRALKMDVAGIEKTGLGSILVEEGPDLLEYVITYDHDFRNEPPPDDKDLMIPATEKPVIDTVIKTNLLKGYDDRETLSKIESFFSTFSYTLDLENKSGNSVLDEFFNKTRSGHCEYFATATTLLLRANGIPARYSTGYSVSEYSLLEKKFLVRSRDAHAWVTAYIDGKWETVDTTPLQWRTFDKKEGSFMEPVKDFFSWLRLQYENFRKQKNEQFNRLLVIIASILTIFMMVRIYFRKKLVRNESEPEHFSGRIEGLDSPFYQVLIKCKEDGIIRNDNETIRKWVIKNSDKLKNHQDLINLVNLHEELRFNPEVKKGEIFDALQKGCDQWIKSD
ncbi:MAG TPA: transglutaminase domain-containing protein [bacterium]|nr:transglutaminase domain-containing protein [bacterium]HPS28720.1 transglutaminase domain-containing protein [bacterium]